MVEPVVRLNVPVVVVEVIAIAELIAIVPVLPLLIVRATGAVDVVEGSSKVIVLLPKPVTEMIPLD